MPPAWEWLIREAHNLKGASANVGAIAVQQDAHALELALKQFVRQSGNASVETGSAGADLLPAARRAGGGLRHRADIRTGSPP